MHPFLYMAVAIAHGVLFTLNIILAVNLTPILGSNVIDEALLPPSTLIGILGCIGIIFSCVLTLVAYDSENNTLSDKAVAATIHAAIVVGLLYTWYYYGMVLIAGSN